jgi:hypothetical protein
MAATTEQMIKDKIVYICEKLDEWLNKEGRSFSSENSFVYNFAWQFCKEYEEVIGNIDFEVPLFKGFSDGKFLDLMVCVKNDTQLIKVGFEFKFPQKKKNGSGQTQVRSAIINDVKRLTWLVRNKKIDIGVFICATNEKGYINKGKYKQNQQFLIHNGMSYLEGEILPFNEDYKEKAKALSDITFKWNHLLNAKNGIHIEEGKFSFLEPIIFSL